MTQAQQPSLDELIRLAKLKREKPEEYKQLMEDVGSVVTDFAIEMTKAMAVMQQKLEEMRQNETNNNRSSTRHPHY